MESVAEVSVPVGVDNGIDDRVGVRQEDGRVHGPLGLLLGPAWLKERGTVDGVYRQPAQSKDPNNHGQGLGRVDLPLEDSPRVAHELHAPELPAGHQEDLDVDDQHYEQRGQDAPKEIEVHHVAHGDHVLKKTLHKAAACVCGSVPGLRAVGGTVFTVPPQERGQADAQGEDPEDSNDPSCSGPSDQTPIPVEKNSICHRQRTALPPKSKTPPLLFVPLPLTASTVQPQGAPWPFTLNTNSSQTGRNSFALTSSIRFSFLITHLCLVTNHGRGEKVENS